MEKKIPWVKFHASQAKFKADKEALKSAEVLLARTRSEVEATLGPLKCGLQPISVPLYTYPCHFTLRWALKMVLRASLLSVGAKQFL